MKLFSLVLLAWCCVATAETDWSSCPPVCKCRWLSGKKVAQCSKQGLSTVPDRLSPEIQSIDLSHNELSILPSEAFQSVGLVNLHKIYLQECGIQELHKDAFKGLNILIELDLSNNKIHSIDPLTFRDNVRLRVFIMRHNPITNLENGLFKDLLFLQTVDMSECNLGKIGNQTFVNVSALQHVVLNGNNLEHLDVAVVEHLDRLTSLALHDNPWRCDCHLRALRDWAIKHDIDVQGTSCAEPPHLANTTWTELDSNNFTCITPPPDEGTTLTYPESPTSSDGGTVQHGHDLDTNISII